MCPPGLEVFTVELILVPAIAALVVFESIVTEGPSGTAFTIVRRKLNIPLILGGGCGLASHFSDGFISGGASAVTAGTFFSFRDQNPIQARSHIMNAGIPIRIHQ